VLVIVAVGAGRASTLLYDIDFESAGHVVGSAPPLIRPNSGPPVYRNLSRPPIFTGQNTVVADGVGNQSLEMVAENFGSFIYSQIFVGAPAANPFPVYHFQSEITLNNFVGAGDTVTAMHDHFAIVVDTPAGVVRATIFDDGLVSAGQEIIGQVDYDELFLLDVSIDLEANRWIFSIDDQTLYDGRFFFPYPASPVPPTAIEGFRIILADGNVSPEVPTLLIDNIQLRGALAIPEPSVWLLLWASAVLMVRHRRR
jgi:hypothetical protein